MPRAKPLASLTRRFDAHKRKNNNIHEGLLLGIEMWSMLRERESECWLRSSLTLNWRRWWRSVRLLTWAYLHFVTGIFFPDGCADRGLIVSPSLWGKTERYRKCSFSIYNHTQIIAANMEQVMVLFLITKKSRYFFLLCQQCVFDLHMEIPTVVLVIHNVRISSKLSFFFRWLFGPSWTFLTSFYH